MITVMFSTFNRSAIVKMTLDGFLRMQPPDESWMLIAVDNGSTDDTRAVLRSYQDRLPLIVLTEPKRGKNRALNLALKRAEGDLFIFCDDDVLVCEDWLTRWRAVANAHQDYLLFAGLTEAHWPHVPPEWILKEVNTSLVYSLNDYMKEGPCDVVEMHGTNMAIRSEVFARGIQFDATIGPDGTPDYAMGSETELNRRLAAIGLLCWFARGPSVGHIIRLEQMEAEWIVRRAYRWGRGLPRLGLPYHSSHLRVTVRNRLKRLIYPALMPLLPPRDCLRRQWYWMADCGYEDGMRDLAGRTPRWRNAQGPIVASCFRKKIRNPQSFPSGATVTV